MTPGITLLNLPARRAAATTRLGKVGIRRPPLDCWFPENTTTIATQGSGGYSCPQASDRALEHWCREKGWLYDLVCQKQSKVAGRWPLPHFYLLKFTIHVQPVGPQLQGRLEHLVLAFPSEAKEGTLEGLRGMLDQLINISPMPSFTVLQSLALWLLSAHTKLFPHAWIFAFAVPSAWNIFPTDLPSPVKHHFPRVIPHSKTS